MQPTDAVLGSPYQRVEITGFRVFESLSGLATS